MVEGLVACCCLLSSIPFLFGQHAEVVYIIHRYTDECCQRYGLVLIICCPPIPRARAQMGPRISAKGTVPEVHADYLEPSKPAQGPFVC